MIPDLATLTRRIVFVSMATASCTLGLGIGKTVSADAHKTVFNIVDFGAVGDGVTDDTAACELIGQRVNLVVGEAPNPKVTVKSDLLYVELLLKELG